MATLRRSRRAASIMYDSNGRDYLASFFDWSRQTLETWLESGKVRPHLQLWYQICISNRKRFNEAVGWIDDGADGYFYSNSGLQKDLLLACLGEGGIAGPRTETSIYTHANTITAKWPTQELWARTVWRIVQDNNAEGDVFHKAAQADSNAVFAFVIDLLCLSFHSIAHRKVGSIWEKIINGSEPKADTSPGLNVKPLEVVMDRLPHEQSEEETEITDDESNTSTSFNKTKTTYSKPLDDPGIKDSNTTKLPGAIHKEDPDSSVSEGAWREANGKMFRDWIQTLVLGTNNEEDL